MSTMTEDQDRLENHAVDNILKDDEHHEEESKQYSLQSDELNAMDRSNIVDGRTRGAAKSSGTYQEPDEDKIDEDREGNAYIKK